MIKTKPFYFDAAEKYVGLVRVFNHNNLYFDVPDLGGFSASITGFCKVPIKAAELDDAVIAIATKYGPETESDLETAKRAYIEILEYWKSTYLVPFDDVRRLARNNKLAIDDGEYDEEIDDPDLLDEDIRLSFISSYREHVISEDEDGNEVIEIRMVHDLGNTTLEFRSDTYGKIEISVDDEDS